MKVTGQDVSRVEFTREMKKTHTILIPNMLPIHFSLVADVLRAEGYKVELLKNEGRAIVDEGLKYVHNDTCYPALLCIGQMIEAIHSGQYDVDHLALMITQTGGGCRASNYIHLLRKALQKAGYGFIPVISLNVSGFEPNSGFAMTSRLFLKAAVALLYGDALMLLRNQVVPYELQPGAADALVSAWQARLSEMIIRGGPKMILTIRGTLKKIVTAFAEIAMAERRKVKVGIVGEIYVKYADFANNHVADFLVGEGCEVVVPGLLAFIAYMADSRAVEVKLYGGSRMRRLVFQAALLLLDGVDRMLATAIKRQKVFDVPSSFRHIRSLVDGVLGHGCQMGEGWLLTAEMLELIDSGCTNIVCAQPFGCLPNHIVGKGMIRKIRALHPQANIVAIDYDPGATQVNQENRIKLMLSLAREQAAGHTAQDVLDEDDIVAAMMPGEPAHMARV